MKKRRADCDVVFSRNIILEPIEEPPKLYRISQTSTAIPVIVDQQSKCKTVRMHAPLQLSASRISVSVKTSPELVYTLDKEDSHDLVLQGVVIRSDTHELLVSHGGMLCQIMPTNESLAIVPRGSSIQTLIKLLRAPHQLESELS